MGTDRRPPAGFTPADIKTLRLLALTVGFIGAVLITMAGDLAGRIIAIALTIALMVVPTLAIYLVRRWRPTGLENSSQTRSRKVAQKAQEIAAAAVPRTTRVDRDS